MICPWSTPLKTATLLRRYKRFLADVELDNGEKITVHCPNTGAMTGCAEPGMRVWLSHSDNPKRKYAYTWQLAQNEQQQWICVHSALANKVMAEALSESRVIELQRDHGWRAEVAYGEGCRADFAIEGDVRSHYMEVKSVTLAGDNGAGMFPDAVSARAKKHLQTLARMSQQGHEAIVCFVVMHQGIEQVAPATHIDPAYTEALAKARSLGVQAYAFSVDISEQGLELAAPLPVLGDGG